MPYISTGIRLDAGKANQQCALRLFHGTEEGIERGNHNAGHRHGEGHLEEGADGAGTYVPSGFLLLLVNGLKGAAWSQTMNIMELII